MTPWAHYTLRQLPIRIFPLRCLTLGAVRLAPGRWIAPFILTTLGELRPASAPLRHSPWRGPAHGVVRPVLSGNGVARVSGSKQVHGTYINGRQINDDNDDQEVNDTNIDQVSPFPPEGWSRG